MEKIRNLIIERFRTQNSRPNHIIDSWAISNNILSELNPKEKDQFDNTAKEMVEEGLITEDNRGGYCLVLTQQGYDYIFPIDEDEAIEKIGNLILNKFRESKAKTGYLLDEWWYAQTLTKELNPKESDLRKKAVDKLTDDGYTTFVENRGITLTEKGFDEIY
jgi:hypothetical protein